MNPNVQTNPRSWSRHRLQHHTRRHDLLLELVSVGDTPTNVLIYWPRPPSVVRVTDFREACDNIAGVLAAAIAKLATIKAGRV